MPELTWDAEGFHDSTWRWVADSAVYKSAEDACQYIVTPRPDGFSLAESDAELLPIPVPFFDTVQGAKAACQMLEAFNGKLAATEDDDVGQTRRVKDEEEK